MLEVEKVTKSFGGLIAVKNVDFQVEQKEIVGLVGPNGAGKSTLLKIINRFYKQDSGTIRFEGEDISRLNSHQVCRMGISGTSQIAQAFPDMTAVENVVIGVLFGKPGRTSVNEAKKKAVEVLRFVEFSEKKMEASAKNLNIAELRRLQLAKALATDPRLLLLDEVTTGLGHIEGEKAIEIIKKIRQNGITILMVEHVMKIIMGLCDRIIVLDHGEKIAEGTPKEVANNEAVIRSYLGEANKYEDTKVWR
ncbi:MAG: ABC transporter ATP-binding protein [archaeon]|nr:ABC transporter ATP-binding protein [archaeon]MCP8319571.1 ABC transporter ATP-binding protein [archaeon]